MTTREFQNEKRKAENRPFSQFAKFAEELKGLEVYRLHKRVYAFELFHFYEKKCIKDLQINPYYTTKIREDEQ